VDKEKKSRQTGGKRLYGKRGKKNESGGRKKNPRTFLNGMLGKKKVGKKRGKEKKKKREKKK